ncbi:uncharacterized protein N7498_004455 [Penicillium cinerascens]|uniref:Uncharacterized protein n=1 Tax=Penicillium cinerascens TaxID=70096 RepID=A0A9W9T836_9EURO|nr:uncharacterized protein N7498_004455 [Penicillium cinerascens]KAJ5212809.1 hypothetical protein N7498_004455 [Penicillium cinerascens]
MVFYAYAISSTHTEEWRFIIAASSVEVMDEWYRSSVEDGMDHLKRKSPELYTYDYKKNYPYDFVYKEGKAANVKYSILFTLVHNAWSIFSTTFFNQFVPDHISGKTFYIRSKSNPRVFWNLSGGTVFASKAARTRFRITSRGVSRGEVILPQDRITISAIDSKALKESTIHWKPDNTFVADAPDAAGGPQVPQGPPGSGSLGHPYPGYVPGAVSEFTFADFKKNLLARGKDVEEADALVSWFTDGGEEWELCN